MAGMGCASWGLSAIETLAVLAGKRFPLTIPCSVFAFPFPFRGSRSRFPVSPEPTVGAPVVRTGAMRPYALRNTDAMQNLVESLLAVQIVDPGVHVAMHDRVLRFPGLTKDYKLGTFVTAS